MSRRELILYSTFPISGAVTTLLGPLLPVLLPRWQFTDAQGGQLFTAQFLASTAGAIASGPLVLRSRPPFVLAGSYLTIAASLAALAFSPPATGWLMVALYGFALGVSIPLTNLLAARAAPARESAALNLLNLAWCSGAVLAPPAIGWLLAIRDVASVLSTIAVLALAVAIATLFVSGSAVRLHPGAGRDPGVRRAAAWTAIFLFLYVGLENGLSGWLPTLAQRATGAGIGQAAITQSLFWGAIMMVRAAGALWLRQSWTALVIVAGTAVGIAGVAIVLVSSTIELMWTGAALAGAGLAPLFASSVALFHRRAGDQAAAWTGPVFATGSFGGAVLPMSVGLISTATGSLAWGVALLLAAGALLLLTAKPLTTTTSDTAQASSK